jgi:hypothetical protein
MGNSTTRRIALMVALAIATSQTAGCNRPMMAVGGVITAGIIAGGAVASARYDGGQIDGGGLLMAGGAALGILTLVAGVIGEAAGMNDTPTQRARRAERRAQTLPRLWP